MGNAQKCDVMAQLEELAGSEVERRTGKSRAQWAEDKIQRRDAEKLSRRLSEFQYRIDAAADPVLIDVQCRDFDGGPGAT